MRSPGSHFAFFAVLFHGLRPTALVNGLQPVAERAQQLPVVVLVQVEIHVVIGKSLWIIAATHSAADPQAPSHRPDPIGRLTRIHLPPSSSEPSPAPGLPCRRSAIIRRRY
jgi:hypothetical protein